MRVLVAGQVRGALIMLDPKPGRTPAEACRATAGRAHQWFELLIR